MNTKNKPVKPRKMWANPSLRHIRMKKLIADNYCSIGEHPRPVLVIDLSPESVEALIEKVAISVAESRNWKGCWENDCPASAKNSYRCDAVAALAAISIKATKPRKSKT